MSLVKENYTLIRGTILVYILVTLSPILSFGQEVCPIWTALEPKVSSDISRNYQSENRGLSNKVSWSLSDSDSKASLNLEGYRISKTLIFKDFGFNIPTGATIQGIKVTVTGRSEGSGFIRDQSIQLSSPNKKSENYAGKGYSTLKIWKKGTTNKKWHYGWPDETWGQSWTSDDINSSDFELGIQVRNLFNQEISGFIDDIKIEVTYLPLVVFCPSDCPIFYVDSIDNTTMYQWRIPNGFKIISKSDQFHIINLHVNPNTPVGKYNICVDAVKNNQIQSSCCRDFRYQMCEPGVIGDLVFEDANRNGIRDNGEEGISGINIQLFDDANNLVNQTDSDQNGKYSFQNIEPGAYYIKVKNTSDYAFSPMVIGDQNNDSNINNANGPGTSNFFNIDFDQVENSIDVGLIGVGTISGLAWTDCDANGIRASLDTLIKQVNIRLLDDNGAIVAEQLTTDGNYLFENVFYGDYQVQFEFEDNFIPTPKNIGASNFDSDINSDYTTDIITLNNTALNNIDGGVFESATVGDQVWYDDNCNGIFDVTENGIPTIKLILINEFNVRIDSTLSGSDGQYKFDFVMPGNYTLEVISTEDYTAISIGDSKLNEVNGKLISDSFLVKSGNIIEDIDLAVINRRANICGLAWFDNNSDGQRAMDEPLLRDLDVYLLDQNLDTLSQTITDISGNYCFNDLLPGDYFVQFAIDSNSIFSLLNAGASDTDNDFNQSGLSKQLTLTSGKSFNNIDAGIVNLGIIGDFVWLDSNKNGSIDPSESGIQDIEVLLKDMSGATIQETTTSLDGSYTFERIQLGEYYIEVIFPIQFAQVLDNGSGSDINSDFTNDNGTNTSSTFTVQANDVNLDLDFGLIPNLGSICGLAFFDENYDGIRDDLEPIIPTTTVNLINDAGSIIQTSITDDEGMYCFVSLEEGKYRIQFEIDDAQFFSPSQIGSPDRNSDVIDETGKTPFINLIVGATITNIDAGIANKAIIGDFVFFDNDNNLIQSIDDDPAEGIKVILFDAISNARLDSTSSQSDGSYQFDKLIPGDYYLQLDLNDQFSGVLKNGLDNTLDSDITNTQGFNTTDIFSLAANDINFDIDFGIKEKEVSICGLVWKDLDADGIRTNTDGLLDQPLIVEVFDNFGTPLFMRNTNLDGTYCFTDLDTGSYYLKVSIGPDLQFTDLDVGTDDTKDNDFNTLGISSTFTLGFGSTVNIDAGLTMTSSIGDFVWMDDNYNGLQDLLEAGIADIEVNLIDEIGFIIDNTSTNQDGFYEFINIKKGNYHVTFINPNTLTFTTQNIDPDLGSDPNQFGITPTFEVFPNENRTDIDAGLALPRGSIKGLVFTDLTNNDQRDPTDNLLPNIGVRLLDNAGAVLMSATTDTEGAYCFIGLEAGEYYVEFDTSEVFEFVTPFIGSSDIDSDVTNSFTKGSTNLITLGIGETINNIDAGYLGIMGLVKGASWLDNDGDGIITSIDGILPNIKVYLFNQDSMLVDSTITNDVGLYTLEIVDDGIYFIVFENQDTCYFPTASEQGMNILLDSDINDKYLANSTDTFTIGGNNMICGINGGYIGYSTISGMSFIDENQDGIQQDIEEGLNDIEVYLLSETGDTIAIDTTRNINGLDGKYEFINLLPGKYNLSYTRPLFYFPTIENIGNDTTDSDFIKTDDFIATTDTLNIISKSEVEFINAGLFFMQEMQSSISGKAWRDEDLNGLQNGNPLIEGITIELFDANNNSIASTITDDLGSYEFDMLLEGFYYVQAYLLNDSTATLLEVGTDHTIDNNFKVLNGEIRTEVFYLPNFIDTTDVDLGFGPAFSIGDFVFMDDNFNGIQDPVESGWEGIEICLLDINDNVYRSTTSNDLGEYSMSRLLTGQYRLQAKLSDSISITKTKIGLGDKDNDFNKNGFTDLMVFDQIGNADTIDLGIVKNGCIGDRVFVDFNGNGRQNTGEPGQPGVKVMLFDPMGNFIALDSTKSNSGTGDEAFYKFTNIPPGDYYIVFDTLPGYMFTSPKIGGDDIDSDVTSSIVFGSTDIFTLQPDGFYMGIDAGIFLPGKLGDFIWEDTNENGIQDAGEPGIEDQTIELTTSGGALLQTTTSDENGYYCFGGLKQGLYQIRFPIINDFNITLQDQGNDDALDSDGDPITGRTSLVSLAHGADFMGVDCGYIESVKNKKVESQKPHHAMVINPNPNPAIFETTMRVDEDGFYQLTLLNAQGQMTKHLRVEAINNIIRVDISDLRAGKFYFHLLGTSGKRYKGSFIRLY